MINIREYHRLLKKYNIKEKDGHLLLPGTVAKWRISKIVKELYLALDDARAEDQNFKLYKLRGFCCHENCVSPQCFEFHINPSSANSCLDKEDIENIAEDMDLKRIELIGARAYLEEYNSTQPDILKLSPADFKTILAYMKGNKNASQKNQHS